MTTSTASEQAVASAGAIIAGATTMLTWRDWWWFLRKEETVVADKLSDEKYHLIEIEYYAHTDAVIVLALDRKALHVWYYIIYNYVLDKKWALDYNVHLLTRFYSM